MAYGTIKVDNITFTNDGSDQTITVSGIVQSISGNITATGTLQGATIIGTSTVSGATVTGNVGNFTTITGGTVTLTSGVIASGTAANPSLSIVGDSNTGLYSYGSDQIALSTGGTGRLFVDAIGRIGVGTASAQRLLEIAGTGGPTGVEFRINATDGGERQITFTGSGSTTQTIRSTGTTDNSLVFLQGTSERLRLTSTGQMGLATSAPAATAHIAGSTIIGNVNVVNASYDGVSFSVAARENGPTGLFFSPDGKQMFTIGTFGKTVDQYTLSTAWNISTASYVTETSVAAQDGVPQDLYIRSDGIKLYMVGTSNDTVYQYTLTSPWDITTLTYDSVSFSVTLDETFPTGLFFKPDGLAMYVIGTTNDTVYRYNLSTAWNVSTAVLNSSFSVTSLETAPGAVTFTGDGSRMFVMGGNGDDVNIFNLTTPWDITTATYVAVFSVAAQEGLPSGLFVKPDGTKMYMVGSINQTIYQYTIPSTTVDITGTTSLHGSVGIDQDLSVKGNIDLNSGRLLVGTNTSFGGASVVPNVQIAGTGASASSVLLTRASDSAGAPILAFAKARGTSAVASTTIVQQDDFLGEIRFAGADGVNRNSLGASIIALVDGTPGATDMPGRLSFRTTPDGTATPTERLRIDSAGTSTFTSAASTAPAIFNISATEVARIDSSGRLLVGYAATADLNGALQIRNDSGNNTQLFRSSADANGPCLNLTKSRGTAAAPTEVSSGDELGIIRFRGYDGAAWQTAAQIQGFANGTWTDAGDTTDNPGSLVFSTVPDGSSTLATRMTIDNGGRILVATAATPSDATAVIRGGPGGTNGAHLQLTHATSPYGGGRISVTNTGGDLAFYTHTGDVGGETYSERLRITSTGNIQIGANGNITADFTNATLASRTYFQTTTANGTTAVGAIPNGTSTGSAFYAFNNSTPTNAAYVGPAITNTAATIRSGITGTGTLLPLTFEVGSIEVARMDTSGRLLVGTSTARSNFHNSTTTALIQAEGTAGLTERGMISVVNNSTADDPPWVYIAKSNGAGLGSNTLVGSTTWLGIVGFGGNDGTEFVTGAYIAAQVDGTPGANDMPCRLLFSTTADGAALPTERLRIAANGLHTINSQAHSGAALSTTAPAKLYLSTGTYTDTSTAASGTVTHGTITAFDNPAIAATNATVTYTNASTVYINGAPTGGTNVTVTNGFALYVNAGNAHFGGSALSASATGGLGYKTGAGGTVTQATSRTTGVTINKICGAITLVSAAGSTAYQSFTVTNSTVAATDTIIVNQKSGTDLYEVFVTAVAAGSFRITFATTGGTTTEQPVFNFSVIKAVTA